MSNVPNKNGHEIAGDILKLILMPVLIITIMLSNCLHYGNHS
ncbi:Uncharacterised protein [Legionella cincinnatiensis]|uniref:Uncharacterized protein n=1 Tax=Legionella cincinnatiensis TaxID=28085 RepID=A0A378IEU7_9GAMM|nr:Uncharacterised protein [Legionella cincinnatiensis]